MSIDTNADCCCLTLLAAGAAVAAAAFNCYLVKLAAITEVADAGAAASTAAVASMFEYYVG